MRTQNIVIFIVVTFSINLAVADLGSQLLNLPITELVIADTPTGHFSSDSPYKLEVNYHYVVKTAENKTTNFYFSKFSVEFEKAACSWDFVYIAIDDSPALGPLCGNATIGYSFYADLVLSQVWEGIEMHIYLISDKQNADAG